MVQRLIGVSIGALVTFGILWLSTTLASEQDLLTWYAAAALIGAVASFLWPVVVAVWARNRRKDRRDDQIQKEVDRQLAERQKQG